MTIKHRFTQLSTALLTAAVSAQVSLAQTSTGGAQAPSGAAATTPAPSTTTSGVLGGANGAHPSSTPDNLFGTGGAFKAISDTLIYIVGAVAVIILIIGGFRYVTSQGSSDQVKQAKDTILYGIIGIVVAILAYAIVAFVAKSLS